MHWVSVRFYEMGDITYLEKGSDDCDTICTLSQRRYAIYLSLCTQSADSNFFGGTAGIKMLNC